MTSSPSLTQPTPPSNAGNVQRQVLSGSPEALLQFLARVTPYQQGDERTHGGTVEPCGHLAQALVNRMRIKPAVELLMDDVRDIMQIRVH